MRSAGRRRPRPRGSIAAPTGVDAQPVWTVLPLGLAWLPPSVRVIVVRLEDASYFNSGPRLAPGEQLLAFEDHLEGRIPEELLRHRARLEIAAHVVGRAFAQIGRASCRERV